MAESRAELNSRAEALGVKTDGRWSDERLRQEITNAEHAKGLYKRPVEAEKGDDGVPPPKDHGWAMTRSTHVRVKLKNGYWPEDGGPKVPAGETVELPAGEARRLVGERKAELEFPAVADEPEQTPAPKGKPEAA
jgi:hypothetical protein